MKRGLASLAAAIVLAASAWALAAPTGLKMRTPAPAPARSAHGGAIGEMDCSACHTSAGWSLGAGAGASGFDHDRTGFPLRGAHVQRACASCHTGGGKPASTCESCHRDPHQGRNDGTCAECHTTTAWTDTATLERHRRTRMPLTGAHATLDCVACHRRQSERAWSDVPRDCIGCHLNDYRRPDIHPIHDGRGGNPALPRACSQCHRTTGWTPAVIVPGGVLGAAARVADHDRSFVLSTGSHRTAECAACHLDQARPRRVRCDGCHTPAALRAQHGRRIATPAAATCLGCHPRGAAR